MLGKMLKAHAWAIQVAVCQRRRGQRLRSAALAAWQAAVAHRRWRADAVERCRGRAAGSRAAAAFAAWQAAAQQRAAAASAAAQLGRRAQQRARCQLMAMGAAGVLSLGVCNLHTNANLHFEQDMHVSGAV